MFKPIAMTCTKKNDDDADKNVDLTVICQIK